MTFGRWLLVHSFSIFLVSLLILGYIYRDELKLEQAYHQLLNIDDEELESISAKSKDDGQVEITPEEPADTPISKEQSISTVEKTESVQTSELEFIAQPTVTEEIIEQDTLLFEARQAYWDKNYEKAIQGYQQLIQRETNNADYLGELGNIYYSLNDFPNASRHYYQAALVLIQQNKIEQARSLISPVTAMNRELGDKLRQRIGQ